jgi:hypothetical protein
LVREDAGADALGLGLQVKLGVEPRVHLNATRVGERRRGW